MYKYISEFALNMTGFFLNMTRFVLGITGFVPNMTGCVLHMNGFVKIGLPLSLYEYIGPKYHLICPKKI